MVQATALPRNEEGIATALGVLKQRFGDRLQTGQAIREQHGHTTTWIANQAPDAVVFPESTEEVARGIRARVFEHTIRNNGGYLSQACSAAEQLAFLYNEGLILGPSTMPAAASRWPKLVLTAPASSGACGDRPRP